MEHTLGNHSLCFLDECWNCYSLVTTKQCAGGPDIHQMCLLISQGINSDGLTKQEKWFLLYLSDHFMSTTTGLVRSRGALVVASTFASGRWGTSSAWF